MNEETDFITSELEETEAEHFTSQATEEEDQEVFQIEPEPKITEIEIYSELTSEPVITELSETAVETETESTATTIDYDAEIYKNTKTSAECLSLLSGLALIIITIVICVAITKVLIDF